MATPTSDIFQGRAPDLGSSIFSGVFAITPGSALPIPTRGLIVGVAGNLSITDMFGVTSVIPVVAGWIPLRVAAVNSSGTTATGLFGLF